jgi:N-acetylmuramoyl-L-alanine amidase
MLDRTRPCQVLVAAGLWIAIAASGVVPALAQSLAPPKVEPATAKPAIPTLRPVPKAAAAAAATSADSERTRFVIALDKPTGYQVSSLARPNRVVVDLGDVHMMLPPENSAPVGLVQSFTGGLAGPGRNRVVIQVTVPVIVESARIEPAADGRSHRLVLEIVPVDEQDKGGKGRRPMKTELFALGAAGVQPPVPKRAVAPRAKSETAFKRTIVIDPGHGGHDSGAMKHGTVEKDVVLQFSLMLRDKLIATGRYNVLMTRDRDVFVPLDDRREFGDRHNAALFIAVHADYASSAASGATIYALRESVANDLTRSAKGQVAAQPLTGDEQARLQKVETIAAGRQDGTASAVRGFLADLAVRDVEVTRERTSLFTRTVVAQMSNTTKMRNDPEKEATFRVLQSGKVPSVLIELAYVSNPEDAKRLKSDEWRDKVSSSIMSAVENYFSHRVANGPW